jgi:ribosome-associated protein
MNEEIPEKLTSDSDTGSVLQAVARMLDMKKAEDILILDISGVSSDMGYFLIATSLSAMHVKNLSNEVIDFLRNIDIKPVRTPVIDIESGWIPLDYGEFIVHLFSKEKREYYQLDKFWQNGKPISWQYTPQHF